MKYPFKESRVGNKIVRRFSEGVDSEELTWHRDREDRIVFVKEGSEWLLQMENELPIKLVVGSSYKIPKNTYHRIMKGAGELVVEIQERSILHEYIRELIMWEDVRKRGNQYCAYVDDKLTKKEKENNPKKYKGKKVGSVQRTKSGKIRMKARACYASKKKANNAMAAAMMG